MNDRGVLYSREGRFREASREFKRALTIDPGDTLVRRNLGSVYFEQRRFGEASAQFKQVLGTRPDDVAIHYLMGICHCRGNRLKEAAFSFEMILRKNPDHPGAINWVRTLERRDCEKLIEGWENFLEKNAGISWYRHIHGINQSVIEQVETVSYALDKSSAGESDEAFPLKEDARKFLAECGEAIDKKALSAAGRKSVNKGRKQVLFPFFYSVGLGDAVIIHQLIREYRKRHPEDYLICAFPGEERPALRKIAACNPDIDESWSISGWENPRFGYLVTRDPLSEVNERGYNPLVWQEAVLLRAMRERDITHIIKYARMPILWNHRRIATRKSYLGWVDAHRTVRLKGDIAKLEIPQEQITWAENWWKAKNIPEEALVVSLHIRENKDKNHSFRNPDFANYLKLIDFLRKRYKAVIVRIGTPELTKIEKEGVIDTTRERLDLLQQGALIRKSHLFIGCHSGPQVFAAALGVPVVAGSYTMDWRLNKCLVTPKTREEDLICLFKRVFDEKGEELSRDDYGGSFFNVKKWTDTPAEEILEAVETMLRRKNMDLH